MDRRALDHALEGSGRNRLRAFDIGNKRREIVVDEIDEGLAQSVQIDTAGTHDLRRFRFVDQCQQQVFKRCELVTARIGQSQGAMNCLFESVRK